jgi:formate hydrogenlyase subunit 3/multisubunit Na+/H+ antiporter MnhD subunit
MRESTYSIACERNTKKNIELSLKLIIKKRIGIVIIISIIIIVITTTTTTTILHDKQKENKSKIPHIYYVETIYVQCTHDITYNL